MKKFITALAATVAMFLLGAGSPAQAQVKQPLYTCGLEFTASGADFQILIGYSKLTGRGVIRCVDIEGNTERLPVSVAIETPVLFPRISISPYVEVKGRATGIGIEFGGPESLLGHYLAVEARASVGVGAGAVLALHGNNGVTFNLGVQSVKGLGITAGATMVKLEKLPTL
jgi:hypothetical protein